MSLNSICPALFCGQALTLLKDLGGTKKGGELITERGAMGQLTDMQDRVAKSEEVRKDLRNVWLSEG